MKIGGNVPEQTPHAVLNVLSLLVIWQWFADVCVTLYRVQ